jgi:hypothetical protein
MKIEFYDKAVWIGSRLAILINARVDGDYVRCYVGKETLGDHFGGDDVEDLVAHFNKHREPILEKARQLITKGMVTSEKELYIKTEHF